MEELFELFSDLELLSQLAANTDWKEHKNFIRHELVYSQDSSEQGAYFCAVSKSLFSSVGEAFPLLLIHDICNYDMWAENNTPCDIVDRQEREHILRTIWIPEYLGLTKDTDTVSYKLVTEFDFRRDWLPIVNQIAFTALRSPIRSIVKYGRIDSWNSSSYIIETDEEYIDFQYWTTA